MKLAISAVTIALAGLIVILGGLAPNGQNQPALAAHQPGCGVISASSTKGVAPYEIRVIFVAGNGTDGTVDYVYTWGDGSAPVGASVPGNTTLDRTHTFANAGRYSVSITVTHQGGAPCTASINFTVNAACPGGGDGEAASHCTVGGIAELAEAAGAPLEAAEPSGLSAGVVAGIAGAIAAGAVALGGGALSAVWYARRRRLG